MFRHPSRTLSRAAVAAENLESRRLFAAIVSGQTVDGTFAAAGQQDTYTFDAAVGTSVVLSFGHAAGSTGFQSKITVFNPANQVVATQSTASIGDEVKVAFTVAAGAGGTYRAVVQDNGSGGTHTGPYALELVEVPATQAADRDGDSGTLVNGGTRFGSLDRRGDLDVYTFPADANDSFELSLAHATSGNSFQGKISVYNTSGVQLETDSTASVSDPVAIARRATVGGTYTVIVESPDSGGTGVGDYALEFVNLPPAPLPTADSDGDSGALTSGATRFASFDRRGDFDVYTLTLAVNDSYELSLAHNDGGSSFEGMLTLYGPDGVLVDEDSTASISDAIKLFGRVTAGNAGTYTVLAKTSFAGGTLLGDYALEFVKIPVASQAVDAEGHGGAISSGQMKSGRIGRVGDFDVFTFVAGAADRFTFTYDPTDNFQASLAIYGPDGALVASDESFTLNEAVSLTRTIAATGGGTYTAVVQDAGGGGDQIGNYNVTLSIVPGGPTVTGVFVAGTGWTTSFRSFIQTSAAGESPFGFRILSVSQTDELPWTNLNQISIRFSEPVNVAADDLVVRGVNVANYAQAATNAFSYDAATFTATWTLATSGIRNDKILLDLDADAGTGVTDASGIRLDGEWTNPVGASTSGDVFPSGDGTPGGDFRFRLNVLPGDVNRSGGSVTGSDVTLVRNSQNFAPGTAGYSILRDVNGSATIFGSDVTLVRNNQGLTLPTSEPSLVAGGGTVITFKRLPFEPLRAVDLETGVKKRSVLL